MEEKQIKDLISDYESRIERLSKKLDIESKRIKLKEFEFELSDPDFWKNREAADLKLKEMGELGDVIKKFDAIILNFENLKNSKNFELDLNGVESDIRRFEIETLFTGKYDKESAIVTISGGAGGQDAEDWASMLYEMYCKFAEKRGWGAKIIDETLGDYQSKTGRHPIKSVTLEIDGKYVYGYLKNESGVHRLVRISPFSPDKKRHTSFALVEVLPAFKNNEVVDLQIPEKDLKIEFSRSSGPGGQNVNKVETAVRIVHLPTGIASASQVERSQAQNRERAMSILISKLNKKMEEEQAKELGQLATKIRPEWGSQIRSYVLHPYKLVKDHRSEIETTQAEQVLDGGLDLFVENDIINSI